MRESGHDFQDDVEEWLARALGRESLPNPNANPTGIWSPGYSFHTFTPTPPCKERQVGEHHACAHDHRGQRVLGDEPDKAGFVAQSPVEVAQERAAAREDNAAIVDIG